MRPPTWKMPSCSNPVIYRKTPWTFVSSSIPLSPWQSLHWITALCLALRGAVTILTYHLQLCSDKRCLKQAFDRTSSGQGQFQIFFFFSLLLLTLGAGHLLLVFSLRLNTPKAPPIDIEQPWPRAWAGVWWMVMVPRRETDCVLPDFRHSDTPLTPHWTHCVGPVIWISRLDTLVTTTRDPPHMLGLPCTLHNVRSSA